MWKIGKYWINPRNIMYVYEEQEKELPLLRVHFHFADTITLRGEDKAALLSCLAQHTVSYPRIVSSDEDIPF